MAACVIALSDHVLERSVHSIDLAIAPSGVALGKAAFDWGRLNKLNAGAFLRHVLEPIDKHAANRVTKFPS